MVSLDSVMIFVASVGTILLLRNWVSLRLSGAMHGVLLILAGLWVGVFLYVADIIAMVFLPRFISPMRSMEVMQSLHMNYSWYVNASATVITTLGLFITLNHLLRRFSEIQLMNTELKAAQLKSEAANIAKSAFLANMSHEIRTPMNGVVGMAELMTMTNLTEIQRSMLSTISMSGRSLLRIIDDILDISKIEAGKLDVEMTETPIREIAEETALTIALAAEEMIVQTSVIIAPGVPEIIKSDPLRLRQIVTNLVSNAVKFSEPSDGKSQGEVLVRLDFNEDGILDIQVSDNGIGMSQEFVDDLFTAFSQEELSTTRRFGGSGLGLSITKNLVELLGGTISVNTKPGFGTTFNVRMKVDVVQPAKMVSFDEPFTVALLFDQERNPDKEEPNEPLFPDVPVLTFYDENKLIAAVEAMPGSCIVGIGTGQLTEINKTIERMKHLGNIKGFMRITDDRTAEFGHSAGNIFTIHRNPILPSSMTKAIVSLAGTPSGLAASKEPEAKIEPSAQSDAKPTVLLVEDNKTNQKVISMQLQSLGYYVLFAENGADGLEAYKTAPVDIVLSDCHMPVMDGFEMTGAIREFEDKNQLEHTPIIAITANALSGEEQRCLQSGFDGYLAKPVKLETLKAALAENLDI